jgi:hypothetical protein
MAVKPESAQGQCRHTYSPRGYNRWHEWARRMAKTHKQTRCRVCGLWEVWVPRAAKLAKRAAAAR